MDSYSHLWCSFIQEKESTEYKVHGCGGILVEVCLYNAVSLRLQISNAKKALFSQNLIGCLIIVRIEANYQETAYNPNRSSRRKLQKWMSTEWIITIPHSFERPSNHKNQNGDNDVENMNDVMSVITVTMHNVLFGQYVSFQANKLRHILKCMSWCDSTYTCPSLFGSKENSIFKVALTSKL